MTLKPLNVRKTRPMKSSDDSGPRRRAVAGATLFLQSNQDLRIGGRSSNAQFQFTLQGDDVRELNAWAPKALQKVRTLPGLADGQR